MEGGVNKAVDGGHDGILSLCLVGYPLDNLHLVLEDGILPGKSPELADVTQPLNFCIPVIRDIFIHDFQDICIRGLHEVQMGLNGFLTMMHFFRKMKPESHRRPVHWFSF